jgi:primosomal protein N' (replication factor Y) (superfamily II helicase)
MNTPNPAHFEGDHQHSAARQEKRIADVLMPLAVETAYSYAVPDAMVLCVGDVVRVPLGARETLGVVWDIRPGAGDNLKRIAARLDLPPIPDNLRKLVDWAAWYTLSPRGSVLAMALKTPDGERPAKARVGVRLTGNQPQRLTPARSKVLAAATTGDSLPKGDLARLAGVSVGVVDGLIDEGVLEALALLAQPVAEPPDPDYAAPALSAEQLSAADALTAAVSRQAFSAILLEGVTGSGKTEVYFEAIATALREGRQALLLMPEIALTAQFTERFSARFGVDPALWHSGVSARKRERLYAALAAGEVKVVVGARSALFLPFHDLGLIIVDEEHEGAYKQDDGVSYHARDMAVARGHIEGSAVVLASATPSIETRVNVARGRYGHVQLPERFGGRLMPDITAIDLRASRPETGRWLAPQMVAALNQTVAAGEQALLFLNRRGYAPLTVCNACGHRWNCPNCSAWLVDHRFRRALVCHHCGHTERRPISCRECGSVDSIAACGPGVERLAEEVVALFPDKRVIVLSSDFPGGMERLKAEFAAIAAGEADIVIGTQLVAKGHNFPGMTLVGVVDADLGLMNGDPRAAERTFQVMQQVAGRAGRGQKPGRALLQTHDPNHPVMHALISGDSAQFYAHEIAGREAAGLPPFGRLAALIVSGTDKAQAEMHAREAARAAMSVGEQEAYRDACVLGPAEAPLSLIRGRYRFRLLIKTPRSFPLQDYLRASLAAAPKPRGSVKVAVDVDPQNFL